MLRGDLAQVVGIAETLPDRLARVQKDEGLTAGRTPPCCERVPHLQRLEEDDRPGEAGYRLGIPRNQPPSGSSPNTRAPRRINVIFEYPLAVTYKDALEIQRLARQYNTKVLTNYVYWSWSAPYYVAKAAVDKGEIGQVYRLSGLNGHGGPGDYRSSTFFGWLMDVKKNGGGAGIDFAAPLMVWALWVKGLPQSVFAHMLYLRPQEFNNVDDNATYILNYKDAVAILEGTWDMAAAPHRQQSDHGQIGVAGVRTRWHRNVQAGGTARWRRPRSGPGYKGPVRSSAAGTVGSAGIHGGPYSQGFAAGRYVGFGHQRRCCTGV